MLSTVVALLGCGAMAANANIITAAEIVVRTLPIPLIRSAVQYERGRRLVNASFENLQPLADSIEGSRSVWPSNRATLHLFSYRPEGNCALTHTARGPSVSSNGSYRFFRRPSVEIRPGRICGQAWPLCRVLKRDLNDAHRLFAHRDQSSISSETWSQDDFGSFLALTAKSRPKGRLQIRASEKF